MDVLRFVLKNDALDQLRNLNDALRPHKLVDMSQNGLSFPDYARAMPYRSITQEGQQPSGVKILMS